MLSVPSIRVGSRDIIKVSLAHSAAVAYPGKPPGARALCSGTCVLPWQPRTALHLYHTVTVKASLPYVVQPGRRGPSSGGLLPTADCNLRHSINSPKIVARHPGRLQHTNLEANVPSPKQAKCFSTIQGEFVYTMRLKKDPQHYRF